MKVNPHKLSMRKERTSINDFKEGLLSGHDEMFSFKDSKLFIGVKDKINHAFNRHFDQKTFEKDKLEAQRRETQKRNSKSRFDKKHVKGKKLIGLFSDLVLKMGFDSTARDINSKILRFVSIICIIFSVGIAGITIFNGKSLDTLVVFLIIIWTLLFAAIYLLGVLIIFLYLDVKMYNRVRQIEEALPDFLQLASANISAGMTVDRALWYAVRSKFGILAVEMEQVAKSTIAGEDLEHALTLLGQKYDSRVLKETMNLIVEGIQSGGEMAGLLNKLSTNIKETQLMRKEIGASVTTYAIFIGVATVLASPMLFALSTQLLLIIQKIFGSMHMDQSVGVSGMFSFNFSGESISIKDFKRFAILVLLISSFFSASIISVIRKGNVKDGIRLIPLFMIVSIILYYGASALFAMLMGGMF